MLTRKEFAAALREDVREFNLAWMAAAHNGGTLPPDFEPLFNMETPMSEKHDVTKSSNPDVQSLLIVIAGLGHQIARLVAEVGAIRGELAALPEQFVVPGPNGEIPPGTIVVSTAESEFESLAEVGQNGAGYPGFGPDGAGGGGGGAALEWNRNPEPYLKSGLSEVDTIIGELQKAEPIPESSISEGEKLAMADVKSSREILDEAHERAEFESADLSAHG